MSVLHMLHVLCVVLIVLASSINSFAFACGAISVAHGVCPLL